MTTIIINRTEDWFEVVSDRRVSGWFNVIEDTKNKLIDGKIPVMINQRPMYIDYVIAITWDSIHREIIDLILSNIQIKYEEEKFSTIYLRKFALELHKAIKDNCWIKEPDISFLFATRDLAVIIWSEWHLEDVYDFASIWSWCILAEGIHMWNPDLDIREYIPRIAKKDLKTSPTFDYLKL